MMFTARVRHAAAPSTQILLTDSAITWANCAYCIASALGLGGRALCEHRHVPLFHMALMSAALMIQVAQARSGASSCAVDALVTHVFDGDTLYAPGVGRVRLLGIDAPELGGRFERPAPFAIEARERLQALVLRRWVRFECDDTREDSYGRRLSYAFVGSRQLVNAQLLREGLARVSARTRLRYWDELRQAEEDAQARRRGMWGERPRLPTTTYTVPRSNSR